eukprot:4916394-Heterocapsa_arctica.AAC.1
MSIPSASHETREKPLVGIGRIETLELIVKDLSDVQLFGLEGMVETEETFHFFKSKLIEAVDQIDLRKPKYRGGRPRKKGTGPWGHGKRSEP